MTRPALLFVLPLALSGCISFGAKPPEALLTLSSVQGAAVGQQQSSAGARTVTVTVPVVPQTLATNRVPVQATPTTVAYVKEALWTEAPNRQFARLLSDALTARTGRVVLTPAQSLADPGARLGGELRNFGLDAGQRQAVVTYDATLVRQDAGQLEKRRFEARVAVAAIDAPSAAAGLNDAANRVATEVADWVGR